MHNAPLKNAQFEESFLETNRHWIAGMKDGEEKERLSSINSQQLTEVREKIKTHQAR